MFLREYFHTCDEGWPVTTIFTQRNVKSDIDRYISFYNDINFQKAMHIIHK